MSLSAHQFPLQTGCRQLVTSMSVHGIQKLDAVWARTYGLDHEFRLIHVLPNSSGLNLLLKYWHRGALLPLKKYLLKLLPFTTVITQKCNSITQSDRNSYLIWFSVLKSETGWQCNLLCSGVYFHTLLIRLKSPHGTVISAVIPLGQTGALCK